MTTIARGLAALAIAGMTSDPCIFAVGDVAQQDSPWLGRHVLLESWQNAQDQAIAELLADAAPGSVKPDQVETNIVVADLSATGRSVAQVVEAAKAEGVLVGGVGATQLRVVTHLDASAADCRAAAETLARLIS